MHLSHLFLATIDFFEAATWQQGNMTQFFNASTPAVQNLVAWVPAPCRESAAEHLAWYVTHCETYTADETPLLATKRDTKRCDAHYEAGDVSAMWGLQCNNLQVTDKEGNPRVVRNACFIEPLGKGKEAEVWRICDAETGTELALKIFRRTVAKDYPARKAQRHNVESYNDSLVFVHTESPWLVHPLNYVTLSSLESEEPPVPDKDLKSVYYHKALLYRLADMDLGDLADLWRGELPEDYVACIGWKLFKGIWDIMEEGKLWMDCKPRNVLIFEDYQPKISDLSYFMPHGALSWSPGMGTPDYRAPELVKAGKDDKTVYQTGATVMFAYGASLFDVVYDARPYGDEETFHDLHYSDGPDFKHWRVISPELKSLLAGLLQVDPSRRMTPDELVKHDFWPEACRECEEGESEPDVCCCVFDLEIEV